MFVHDLEIVWYWSAHCDKPLDIFLEGKHGEELKCFSWLQWRGGQGSLGEWDLLFSLLQCLTYLFWAVAFSVILHFHQAIECWKTDSTMMLYLLAHGSCSSILMPPFAFQSRNHLLVCVDVFMFTTPSRQGTRHMISTPKFCSGNISSFCLHTDGPCVYTWNNLHVMI